MGKTFSKIPEEARIFALEQFQQQEVYELNKAFRRLSEGGTMTRIDHDTFGEYFSYPGVLREQIFRIFDSNKDGYIDREEFFSGLAMCCKGTLQEKLQFCFNMFDLSGDGYIDKDELKRCLESTAFSSFSLLQAAAKELGDNECDIEVEHSEFKEDIAEMVNEAFDTCDLDRNQKLCLEEFKRWILETPEITSIIYSVFEMRQIVTVDEVNQEFASQRDHQRLNCKRKHLQALRKTIEMTLDQNNQYRRDIANLRAEIDAL